MDERAFQASFLGAFGTMLVGLDIFSLIIMLILALILANAIAMSVRERTHEYGVLRAIGFSPKYIVGFIVGESVLIALVGGVIGALLTQLLINGAMGPAIEQNSGIFAYFRTPVSVLIFAVIASALIGAIAGAIPSVRAARLKVTDALRRVD
jgi:putative ABC transport system permease protein